MATVKKSVAKAAAGRVVKTTYTCLQTIVCYPFRCCCVRRWGEDSDDDQPDAAHDGDGTGYDPAAESDEMSDSSSSSSEKKNGPYLDPNAYLSGQRVAEPKSCYHLAYAPQLKPDQALHQAQASHYQQPPTPEITIP